MQADLVFRADCRFIIKIQENVAVIHFIFIIIVLCRIER